MNLGFVIGESAVAVIDSGYGEAMANAMLAQIRQITDLPVRHVVSTNSQPHRIMGNPVFRDAGAETVAGAEAVPRMNAEGPGFATTVDEVLGLPAGSTKPPGPPDTAVEAESILDLGGVQLRLVPVGHAHTAGSLVAIVEPDGTVFAGDVLYRGRLLSVVSDSQIEGWIAAFQQLTGLDGYLFVPGHGEPGTLADFDHSTRAYLVALKDHMDQAVDEGLDLQDAIGAFDPSPWRELENFDLLSGPNAHQAYVQSEAAAFE
jgi:glyoxylase-like metal-dependent hydrolase (beta-lactamase superfamily II)